MSKTIILNDVEEHQANLLKEIFEEFAARHRNDEKAELNGRHIGETELVQIEELTDTIFTGDIEDMEYGELADLMDWVGDEDFGQYVNDKLVGKRG